MCGIFGIVSPRTTSRKIGDEIGTSIRHRGPDGKGYYADADVRLGIRRLAVIDLVTGDQPIYNEDNTIVIVCNGEIYNHEEIREYLQQKGHIFITNSDAETIVHLYEELGDECVHKLRGMFAFAIWDKTKKRLLLARDRIGIKPLFYSF